MVQFLRLAREVVTESQQKMIDALELHDNYEKNLALRITFPAGGKPAGKGSRSIFL